MEKCIVSKCKRIVFCDPISVMCYGSFRKWPGSEQPRSHYEPIHFRRYGSLLIDIDVDPNLCMFIYSCTICHWWPHITTPLQLGVVNLVDVDIWIDGYPATPLHCPRDRSPPVAGCYFSGSPRAALVSRLQSTSPTSRPEFRLGNREQWSSTAHVFLSNS